MARQLTTREKKRLRFGHPQVFASFCVTVLLLALNAGGEAPNTALLYALPDDTAKGARCVFEKESYDFGAVLQGQSVERSFRFQNKGTKALIITRVKSSCGCTFPELRRRHYKPGQRGELQVTFDSKSRVGPQNKIITIETNDPARPRIQLTLNGTIIVPPRPVLNLDPESIKLGRAKKGDDLEFSFLISNTGQKRLRLKVLQKDPGLSLENKGSWELPSGATLIERARLKIPKNQSGLIKRFLYFSSNDPEHSIKALEVRAYVTPEDKPRLQLSRASVDFGQVEEGKAALIQKMIISNTGPKTLTLKKPLSSHARVKARLDKQSIPPFQSTVLHISLKGLHPELTRETVTLLSDSAENASLKIPVYAYSKGATAKIPTLIHGRSSQTTEHSLGLIQSGEKLKFTLALVNDGKAPVSWPRFAPNLGPLRVRRLETKTLFKAGETAHYIFEGRIPKTPGAFQWTMPWPEKSAQGQLTLQGYIAAKAQPKLALTVKQWDLGVLGCETRCERSIFVTNSGSAELELQSVSLILTGNDPCLRLIDPPRGPLKAGQSKEIKLAFRGRRSLGLVEAILSVKTNDPKQRRLRIPISAWVAPGPKEKRLRIYYNSDEAGAMEPCGCGGKEQLGGLPRLASALKSLRAAPNQAPFQLTLSAGDIAGGPTELDKRRAKAAFKSFGALGYQAFVPGELDFDLGLRTLQNLAEKAQMTLLCANLKVDPKIHKAPKAYTVKRFGELRVAIVGLINRDLITRNEKGLLFLDPSATLKALMPTLKKNSDLIVILAHMGQRYAVQLCAEVPGADVVVIGHGTEVMTKARVIEGTHFVANPDQGKRLASLDLVLNSKLQAIGHHGEAYPLDQRYPNDPTIDAHLTEYRKSLRDLPPKIVKPRPEDQRYVGDKVCGSCHEAERKLWKQSSHAKAMLSLEAKFNDYDPKCTACHTVGQNKAHGFTRRDLTPKLDEVQCESCHGPGEKHSEVPKEQGIPGGTAMPSLGLKSCRLCHNGLHSPQFKPESYWKRVAHGEKSLLKIWDQNKDQALSDSERAAMKRFQTQEASREQARRRRYKEGKKSKKDQ